jgi:hypothetical protein
MQGCKMRAAVGWAKISRTRTLARVTVKDTRKMAM